MITYLFLLDFCRLTMRLTGLEKLVLLFDFIDKIYLALMTTVKVSNNKSVKRKAAKALHGNKCFGIRPPFACSNIKQKRNR
jgi:hypothetical protein